MIKVTTVHSFLLSLAQLGLTEPSYYFYLNQSGTYTVDGTDDRKEYQETRVGFLHTLDYIVGCNGEQVFVMSVLWLGFSWFISE